MKYLFIALALVLLAGCSHTQVKSDVQTLKNNTRDLLEYGKINNRQLAWLVNQDAIKKMAPTYPEDIKIIKPVVSKFWQDNQKLWVPTIVDVQEYEILQQQNFLIPIPMYENEEHGRVYLLFDPQSARNNFFIQVNKQKVILSTDSTWSYSVFSKKWEKSKPQWSRDKKLFKGSYILGMLYEY